MDKINAKIDQISEKAVIAVLDFIFKVISKILFGVSVTVVMLWIPIMLLSLLGGVVGFVVAGLVVFSSFVILSFYE
jgi:thiamine transporter ThiT